MNHIAESTFPLTFQEADCKKLGQSLLKRHSVEIVGMKRVGISTFLRYFFHHPDVVKTYVHKAQRHLFIPIDLNDMVEIELRMFWRLTLKRIVDTINKNSDLAEIREHANSIFEKTDQLDSFSLIDSIREIVALLISLNLYPTIFFVRFDRLVDVVTKNFFHNLMGIIESTNQTLTYVFTSYRGLNDLRPDVFEKSATLPFVDRLYLTPFAPQDTEIIYDSLYKSKYHFSENKQVKKRIVDLSGGHIQYLNFLMNIAQENEEDIAADPKKIMTYAEEDERIMLQSEELYENLSQTEKELVNTVAQKGETSAAPKTFPYLFNAGYIVKDDTPRLFSRLLSSYRAREQQKKKGTKSEKQQVFTKKELLLFQLLKKNKDEICERDLIIQTVWSECNELGVSDWAVDRLVSRLRSKLKTIDPSVKIETVKTRGFVLK